MSDDDRLDRLEQRVAILEQLLRQALAQGSGLQTDVPRSPLRGPPSHPGPDAAESSVQPGPQTGAETQRPAPRKPAPPRPLRSPESGPMSAPPPSSAPGFSEQWVGARGLLAVGVVFLVLAVGYLLKLAIDRGWISPLIRCAGGAVVGAVVGGLGWRLFGRGLKTYGAALIGAGAAIIYLAVWAATKLFGFLPPTTGIAALALISLALAAIALAIDLEALGSTAVFGAFLAPIVLGKDAGSVNGLLLYLGCMAAAMGWVAGYRRWRFTTFLVALSYFGLATSGILQAASAPGLLAYALFGGAAGLFVGLREHWWETRLLSFIGGWGVLGLANGRLDNHWATLVGGLILAAPVWWQALLGPGVWPGRGSTDPRIQFWSFGESLYFFVTPVLLGWALNEVAPQWFHPHEGLVAAIVATPYLIAGYSAERRPFAIVGTTALALAALEHWSGLGAPIALLALTHLWAWLDHPLRRTDGRWYALLALGLAIAHLVSADLPSRPDSDLAFVGGWALILWLSVETLAVLAAGLLWVPEAGGSGRAEPDLRAILWTFAGGLVFMGVTGELVRYFDHSSMEASTRSLAGGLAVSAWWILFAGSLVLFGFRRSLKTARQAGIAVLGLAVLKVLLWDLSSLDALYRVASALILGVMSLALAYLYNRAGRSES